jgi:hypothetical protein
MMMKTFKYLLLLVGITVTTASCDDYLDPEPDGRRTEATIFSNYTYANGFFANIYAQLPTGFHSVDNAMEDCATDDAEHSNVLSAVQMYNNGSWNALSYPDYYVYAKNYAALRKIAIFLDNVDKAVFIDPTTYNRSPEKNKTYQERYKAETFFLRAFFYFEMVKRYGGVPIVPERTLTLDDELNLPRNTYDECVAYIVANCDSAAAKLPAKYTETEWIGHATKASALALKSRILLYAASALHNPSNDIEKWKTAAAAAKEVMDLTDYGLLLSAASVKDKLAPIWAEFYNKEVLFSNPYFNNNDLEFKNFPVGFQGGQGLTNPTQDLVDAFEMSNGVPISESTSYNPQNPYNRRDPRLAMVIGYNTLVYNTRPIETYVGGLDGLNKDAYSTKTGYYIRKFINTSANLVENTSQGRHAWVHFRYAETLLNYAEAMNEAYGPEVLPNGYTVTALQAINQIRSRVSLTTIKAPITQEAFRKRVRNERRVELCFEGHRAWDVRRWQEGALFNKPIHGMRIALTATTPSKTYAYEVFEVEQRTFDETKMYLMPLPNQEVVKSKGILQQNPNW